MSVGLRAPRARGRRGPILFVAAVVVVVAGLVVGLVLGLSGDDSSTAASTTTAHRHASTTTSSTATTTTIPPIAGDQPLLGVPGGAAPFGAQLVAAPGNTLQAPAVSISTWKAAKYQWLHCQLDGRGCVAVKGASATSYKVPPSAAGHSVRVDVTVRAPGSARTLLLRSAPVQIG